MKAISLLQPWASLIATGEKQFETRSWSTKYRGQIAIHASAKKCPEEYLHREPFESVLRNHSFHSADLLPTGCVIAVGYLVQCISTCAFPRYAHLGHREMAFGNFGPDRYAWKIERVTAFDIPIVAKGKLGLWNWDVEKHIHPLQLDVIERVITLWSNPGEKVFTPFMGVGSEVYGAVILGRLGIGVELKASYYQQAVKNVGAALLEKREQNELEFSEPSQEKEAV